MVQRVCIIGAGVVGLATAYALVREGFEVTLVEARERGGLETSYANGGQLSYRYAAPLADSGVPIQALGWLLRDDAPLRLRPRFDPAQWRWLLGFLAACRGSLNRRNAAHLLRLALFSQRTLQVWREDDGLVGFDWRRNGKLVAFVARRASSTRARAWRIPPPSSSCPPPSAARWSRPWPRCRWSVPSIRRTRRSPTATPSACDLSSACRLPDVAGCCMAAG